MSSACTKVFILSRCRCVELDSCSSFTPFFPHQPTLQCVLENLNLSVRVRISVQTLGSNGLISEGVDVVYRTPDQTDNL